MAIKRILSRVTVLLLSGAIMLGFAGCLAPLDRGKIDPTKIQIYVHAYNGGNGTEWLKDFASDWNKTNSKYEVIINPSKTSTKDLIPAINAGATGATSPSLYYVGSPEYQEVIYSDKLENLEDMLSLKLDGEDNPTLGQKLGASDSHYEQWKEMASKNGEGMYMLPLTDNFGLMIFDYQDFLDNNYLLYAPNDSQTKAELTRQGVSYEILGSKLTYGGEYTGDYPYFCYEEGDYILTAGKDGVYGSYDDGQPETMDEFRTMVGKIRSSHVKSKPFIWTSQYSTYVDMISTAAMVQYLGVEEANTYYSYDGKITVGGVQKDIAMANGRDVFGNDGYKKAVEFMHEFLSTPENAYSQSRSGIISHTEAQTFFVLASSFKKGNKEFGNILIDGEWFEKEAEAAFKAVESEGRGYGQREYRVMFLPAFEGQKGIDGEGNGSAVAVLNNGAILVPKQPNTEAGRDKVAAIKSFIAYTLKNEQLQRLTLNTGVVAAYRYDITKEQYNSLTPFGRICYQIHKDTKNVYLSRGETRHLTSYLTVSSSKVGLAFPVRIGGVAEGSTISALIKRVNAGSANPVQDIINGAKAYYTSSDWQEILTATRNNGFNID